MKECVVAAFSYSTKQNLVRNRAMNQFAEFWFVVQSFKVSSMKLERFMDLSMVKTRSNKF